ncbi:MAG: PLD nuclease N-terminal domain-containing protein [Armatimonadota bacterium]
MAHPDGPPVVFIAAIIAFYALFIGLAIGLTVLWIVELIDCTKREFKEPNEKLIWILIIVLCHGLGAIVYWVVGRKKGRLPGEAWPV